MTSTATIRSLNADFKRKGIVASDVDVDVPPLLPQVLPLIEMLKASCRSACKDTGEVSTTIQIWKERSLHHTLQTLDSLCAELTNAGGATVDVAVTSVSTERQIQAIEMHEKSGREIRNMLTRFLQQTAETISRLIDSFAAQLARVLQDTVKPELEAECAKQQGAVIKLMEEKMALEQTTQLLMETNNVLSTRVETLESSPAVGGDAQLCQKLRDKVEALTIDKQALTTTLAQLEQGQSEREWERDHLQTELGKVQQTLIMTQAMHEKETKQLVELIHHRQVQFQQVLAAANSSSSHMSSTNNLDVYDSQSMSTVRFTTPPKPTLGVVKTRLVTATPPVSPKRRATQQPASPRSRIFNPAARDTIGKNVPEDVPRPALPSPKGRVSRPFSSRAPSSQT